MRKYRLPPTFIALAIYLLSLSSVTYATDPFAQPQGLSSQPSFSTTTEKPFSTPSFLRVDEAYQLTPSWSTSTETLGGELTLHWNIASGYYLYKDQLKAEANQLTIEVTHPAGITKFDEYFEKDVEVYYDSLTLNLPANDNSQLQIKSQGCADAGLCYPPQTQTIIIRDGVAKIQQPVSATATRNTGVTPNAQTGLDWALLLSSLIGALIGGVILNLMPCVFPVLSIKALSLSKAHEAPQRQHLHGWSYTIGCVTTFVAIAATMFALRAGGEAIGWGFQLQSPIVVGSLAYLFFIMALLMFGSFHWPNQLSGIGQQLTEGDKLPASFFTGVLATIVASPCTAPFMGSALGYAMTLPATLGLLVFAALGFGMAVPFLLLSYFPQLSSRLPKPGVWMETFKQLLTFPLLLTAIWLLWIFARQTSADQAMLLLSGALALSFALWLTQRLNHSTATRSLRAILIALSLVAAAQPFGSSMQQSNLVNISSTGEWQTYTAQRLNELRNNNTPVFINLTADWCITCLANEKFTLSHDSVKHALKEGGIATLKGDWTHYNPEITSLLEKHGRNGVPLYLLYPANKEQLPQILPQILNKADLLDTIAHHTK